MKASLPSKNERRALLGVAFLTSVCFAIFLALDIVESAKISRIREAYPQFSFDYVVIWLPGFHSLIILLLVALVVARKYIVSTFLTFLYALLFTIGMYMRLDGRGYFSGEGFYTSLPTEILAKTHPYEYLAAIFVLVILFWQVSILWRRSRHLTP